MARAATPEPAQPRRFALPPLPCARKCGALASLGDQVIDGAKLGWLCRQCRQQQQSSKARS